MTGSPQMTLYDYTFCGAVCSNLITPRILPLIRANFPSVIEYVIPEFLTDRHTVRNKILYFTPALNHWNAVCVTWISTNDLGVNCLLTDSQVPRKTLTDYINYDFAGLNTLYAAEAYYSIATNVIPLQLTPLYANNSSRGLGPNQYWPNKPDNHTGIAELMTEFITSVNTIYKQ